MVYAKSYFDGAETFLTPKIIEEIYSKDSLLEQEAIFTISLDTRTRILLEAFLFMQNAGKSDFLDFTYDIGNDFIHKCVLLRERYELLKGQNSSKLDLAFMICESEDSLVDEQLVARLEKCKNEALASKHLTENFLKKEVEDVIYYVKDAGEEVPYWVSVLSTHANLSKIRPTYCTGESNALEGYSILQGETPEIALKDLVRFRNKLIDQMVYTTEAYNHVIRAERVSLSIQKALEVIAIEHRCTSMAELIEVLEEVI